MRSKQIRVAVTVLLFAVGSGLAWTQQDEPREAAGEAAADTATTPGPEPADKSGSGDQAPPKPGQSPFEYESSEQISEDLSVSFPVDIQDP